MRIEELQSSLEAQELRLTKRNSEREPERALESFFVKKNKKQAWSQNKRKSGGVQNSKFSNLDEKKHKSVQKENEKFDKSSVQCYSCNKFGHFATDYWLNKSRKGEKANIVRGDYDVEPVLLMASENEGEKMVDWWYRTLDAQIT